LVLVGKGVTFDTGGISIKPAEKMHVMRGDMAGAAAVLGAMEIIANLKPNIRVTGIVVTAENTPDANAMRPGDILVYRNGKSVHIENTDAEGRLILADGLLRAGDIGATHILDIATLTGAAARALGGSFTALMGNNRVLINAVTRAGGNHGEAYWKFPLPAEYKELIKSPVADINNMGGVAAGAITAGLFLQEFVPSGAAWAHLDIAPTFWKEKF
jgi:leucyl aminopeptidase